MVNTLTVSTKNTTPWMGYTGYCDATLNTLAWFICEQEVAKYMNVDLWLKGIHITGLECLVMAKMVWELGKENPTGPKILQGFGDNSAVTVIHHKGNARTRGMEVMYDTIRYLCRKYNITFYARWLMTENNKPADGMTRDMVDGGIREEKLLKLFSDSNEEWFPHMNMSKLGCPQTKCRIRRVEEDDPRSLGAHTPRHYK